MRGLWKRYTISSARKRRRVFGRGWMGENVAWCVDVVFGLVRTFRSSEVDDVAVFLEHVDLLDGLDWLDVQLLERRLQLLVVRAG
jgi:hypothetical protein